MMLQDSDVFRRPDRLLLGTPPPLRGDVVDAPDDADALGMLGPYLLLELLDECGLGTVYRARRVDERHRVMLRHVRRDLLDLPSADEILRRFGNERPDELEHPNIARLVDGGATDDGDPYLVTENVDGVRLTDFCDQRRLPVEMRVQLFLQVCAAVEHGHQRGVVHRNLKRCNILVVEPADVKILDFGVAKLLAVLDGAEPAATSGLGRRLLAPGYVSPEQLRGDRVTPASDVYALGALLHEILTGTVPRPGPAVLPSVASAQVPADVASARRMEPFELPRRLNGDLDTILLRALHENPRRRFPSAGALADDLRRHLAGERIRARRDSLSYRLLHRHPAP